MDGDRMADAAPAERKTIAEIVHFASALPLGKSREHAAEGELRRWADVPAEELRNEMLHRNGRFQSLLGWMRHSLQANAVLDLTGRVLYINQAAEHLWNVRLWDVQGKNLCQIMHLNEMETVRDQRERHRIIEGHVPEVLMEGFHNGGEHVSILYFPYPDDHGDALLGAFILPLAIHRSSDGQSRGYQNRDR
jgi:PAS domain-containing protein